MSKFIETKEIELQGLGFVFHSGGILKSRENGYDFLENEFWEPEDVCKYVNKGDMTAFCTGSPGSYNLNFYNGVQSDNEGEDNKKYAAEVHLAIKIDSGILYIRDLYELSEWDRECKETEFLSLDNGIYLLSAYKNEITSDEFYENGQDIDIFLHKVEEMPKLDFDNVPMLF
ncbi:hypothetical protein BCR36DRAFT_586396 [Piromyces finnis]|uniref:Uncharacterized protein n=1 Tax=Piromyces finnis TaxID=1754191 RepID=A0A1Y1UZ82_9FUNG|nr:hypothetical protein BCR36DRAFT_586396 [Piromyces finnis]|eukprot:ORX43926.1 hypothetical protein BCR36DRAFT_586396 [Piromyces finnis]